MLSYSGQVLYLNCMREFAHLIFLAATAAKSWLQQTRPVSLNLHTGYTLPSHHRARITEYTTLLCESAELARPHRHIHTCCFFSWNRSISSLKNSSAFYNTRNGRQFMQAAARTHTHTHTHTLHIDTSMRIQSKLAWCFRKDFLERL